MSEPTEPQSPQNQRDTFSRRQFLKAGGGALAAAPHAVAAALKDQPSPSPELSSEQADSILAEALTTLKVGLETQANGKEAPLLLGSAIAATLPESSQEYPPPSTRKPVADFSSFEWPPERSRRPIADFSSFTGLDAAPDPTRRRFIKESLKTTAAALAASRAAKIGLTVGGSLATAAFFIDRAKHQPIAVEAAGGEPLFLTPPSSEATISPELEAGLNKYFDASATPASPTPTRTTAPEPPNVGFPPAPTETEVPPPTPTPERVPEIVGDKNLLEYFFAAIPQFEALRQRRFDRVKHDPAAAERIDSELLNSPRLNFVYLGIDNTTDRPNEHNNQGWGRSDIIMVISIDPKTFQTTALSIPRDLFAPELINFHFAGNKINGLTMADYAALAYPEIKDTVPATNWVDMTRIILESATGLPIDFIIKTDIDFMDGFDRQGTGGIFSALFPEGLKLWVDQVHDSEYPVENYGATEINFEPGEQTLNGWELTAYARARHESSDFSRTYRQRQILQAAIKHLTPQVLNDLAQGTTDTIDTIIAGFNQQAEQNTFFSDVDVVGILETIRNHLHTLLETPTGKLTLAALATNTTDETANIIENKDTIFTSFGLSRDEVPESGEHSMLQNIEGTTTLTLVGSDLENPPTPNGNFLSYWTPLRDQVKELLRAS